MSQVGKGSGTAASAASGKSLTELRDICIYHGWNNPTANGLAALTRFINRTLYQLSNLGPWPEYHKRDGRITLATDDEDYACTDDSDATLDNILKIGDVFRTDRMSPLDVMAGGIDEWLEKTKTYPQTGTPREYALRAYTYNGLRRLEMLVYPKPTSGQNGDYMYFPYQLLPTELVNASDTTDWPTYRLWLLEEALERRIASGKRDKLAVILEAPDFMAQVQRALGESRTSYMPIPAAEPIDIRHRSIREIYPVIIS